MSLGSPSPLEPVATTSLNRLPLIVGNGRRQRVGGHQWRWQRQEGDDSNGVRGIDEWCLIRVHKGKTRRYKNTQHESGSRYVGDAEQGIDVIEIEL